MELQPIFKKKETRKHFQNEMQSRLLTNRAILDDNLETNNIDNSLEKTIFKTSSLTNIDKLKLSSSIGSADSVEFALKSLDVVVDIHKECKEESSIKDENQSETDDTKCVSLSREKSKNFKKLLKTNTFQDKTGEGVTLSLNKQQNFNKNSNNIKIIHSTDTIEELESLSINEKDENGSGTVKCTYTLTEQNQFLIEKNFNRKQWTISNGNVKDEKRRGRKRWSKNISAIQVPQTTGNSCTSLPLQNKAPLVQNLDVTLSTAKLVTEQKSKNVFGIHNVAFEYDNGETQISTDNNREDMEMRIKDDIKCMKVSNFINKSSHHSSGHKNKSFKKTSVRKKDLTESIKTHEQTIQNLKTDIVHIEDVNNHRKNSKEEKNCRSGTRAMESCALKGKKNLSSYTNMSQSLIEVMDQADSYSSNETTMEGDQNFTNTKYKSRLKSHIIKEARDSEEYLLNPINDEIVDTTDHSMNTLHTNSSEISIKQYCNKLQSKERNLQKNKLKSTRHQSQIKQKMDKTYHHDNISNTSTPIVILNTQENSKKKKNNGAENGKKYISVTIHRADMLEVDYVAKQPMVKIHIVNIENGKYLKNKSGSSKYLQPIITGKFDFKKNKSITPLWEEELIFEHDFDELLNNGNEQTIVLFEIVDLLSFAEASFNYDKFGHESCWYKIAWAFLKPIGNNNILHIDKKVRLQLYKPRKSLKRFEKLDTCEVYTWWKSNNREKYPSSLFVTIKAVDPPKLQTIFYKQLSLHDLSHVYHESQKATSRTSDTLNLAKWTRLTAQSCKVPNKIVFETDISEKGCFHTVFSNSGKYLACSFSEEYDYPIIVYEVETKKIHVRFSGHKAFVYSLNWSNNDNFLLSTSSDQTARIWDLKNQIILHIEMMPHPSYVYCGKFDPGNSLIVVTGCYDRIARIWIGNKRSENYDLSQELEGHEGFVNSMCFQKNSNLLTADSAGIIILWTVKKNRRLPYKKEWYISRKIRMKEIDDVIINTIVLHPLESRLLIHLINNELRMLDLATGAILQKYNESNNYRIKSTACISPCGGLIFCGGEDSSLNVWNLESGNLIAKYRFDRNYGVVTCVDYHPYDHMLAFSTFGSPSPTRILEFDKNAINEDIGLQVIEENENKVDTGAAFLNMSEISKEKLQIPNEADIIEETTRENSFQSSKTYDSTYFKLSNNVLSESDKYDKGKIKLHCLNEAGQSLKNRSVHRLYNIIEKIDKILLNTSRSSADIESGRDISTHREFSKNQILTNLNENVAQKKRFHRNGDTANLSLEDQSNSYFESSVTSNNKQDVIELDIYKSRIKSTDICASDMSSNSFNSPMNCENIEICDKFDTSKLEKITDSAFIINTKENITTAAISHENHDFNKDDTSSFDSACTYTVESNKNSNNIRNDILEHSESSTSLLSNATFTIESKLAVPKTKKENKC